MSDTPHMIIPSRRDPDTYSVRGVTDVVWRETQPAPPHITPEFLNECILALRESSLPDPDESIAKFLTRIGFDLYIQTAPTISRSSGYIFESMHRGQTIRVDRADESRIRQALFRFRIKQPEWQFTLRVCPQDHKFLNLVRIL